MNMATPSLARIVLLPAAACILASTSPGLDPWSRDDCPSDCEASTVLSGLGTPVHGLDISFTPTAPAQDGTGELENCSTCIPCSQALRFDFDGRFAEGGPWCVTLSIDGSPWNSPPLDNYHRSGVLKTNCDAVPTDWTASAQPCGGGPALPISRTVQLFCPCVPQ